MGPRGASVCLGQRYHDWHAGDVNRTEPVERRQCRRSMGECLGLYCPEYVSRLSRCHVIVVCARVSVGGGRVESAGGATLGRDRATV